MAKYTQPRTVPSVATAPQHYAPPTSREKRAQAVHRLQVGLLGLAAMLLLVGLANIILNRVRVSEAATGTVVVGKNATTNDPLADIGVAPAATSTDATPAAKTGR